MIDEKLNSRLINMGFRRIDSNAQGIYLFYYATEQEIVAVSVIHAPEGNEITKEQYEHILKQIKDNFRRSNPQSIKLLSLVLTLHPEGVKHLLSEEGEDSHWVIDAGQNRLMIYETQAYDFAGLKGAIEQLLEEELSQQGSAGNYGSRPQNPYGMQSYSRGRTLQLSIVNTIIVVVNVVAYLVTHYTGAFGGAEPMFEKGALSWYYVIREKEYYRIITSMFMHADWSHLINNMIVLLFVGVYLEKALGKWKYLLIYLGTGIVAGITSISYNMWKESGYYHAGNSVFSIGASGAIFGIVGAILYIVIVNKGHLKEISMRQMIMFVALSLYGGIANSQIDQAAHVGGFLAGMLLALILYRRTVNREQKEAV